jgi:type VI secretion system secreted protein VgrG
MKRNLILAAFAMLLYGSSTGLAGPTVLGTAQDFAVLGGSGVTNTGTSTFTGDVGSSPTPAVSGITPVMVTGTLYTAADAATASAQTDLSTAYNGLAGMTTITQNLTGQDLGGLTLTSGVYKFNSSAQLTGTLKLDAQGNNNAYWVFQIGSTLTTASASGIEVINYGSNNGFDDGLFWQVGSSATLGTTTAFEGNILAQTSITLNTGATIDNGRALAEIGAVTLDTNTISNVCPYPNLGPGFSGGLEFDTSGKLVPINPAGPAVVPVPGAFLLVSSGLMSLFAFKKRMFSVA